MMSQEKFSTVSTLSLNSSTTTFTHNATDFSTFQQLWNTSNLTSIIPSTLPRVNESTLPILEKLNDEKARLYIPVIVYMCVLLLVGTLGNIIVLVVYAGQKKKSSSDYFILSLSVLDLLCCVVGMPTEIYDLLFPYLFYSAAACKVLRYTESATTISSVLVLVNVAFDRYFRICKTSRVSKATTTKKICMVVVCASFVTAIPHALVSGIQTTDTGIVGVTGFDCSTEGRLRGTKYPLMWYAFLMLIFVTSLVVFATLYTRIGYEVWKRKKIMTIHRQQPKPMEMEAQSNSDSRDSMAGSSDAVNRCPSSSNDTASSGHMMSGPIISDFIISEFMISVPISSVPTNSDHKSSDPISSEPTSSVPNNSGTTSSGTNSSEPISRVPISNNPTSSVPNNSVPVSSVPVSNVRISSVICSKPISSVSISNDPTSIASITSDNDKSSDPISIDTTADRITPDQTSEKVIESTNDQATKALTPLRYKPTTSSASLSPLRTTLILFVVTLVFVLSFLPFLTVMVLRSIIHNFEQSLTGTEEVVYKFCLKSFLINNSVNPIIYSFLNASFRHRAAAKLSWLCRCCRK